MAFCCVLAVIGAIAITKLELAGDPGHSEGIIRWLLFALACGLVINDQKGRPFKVMAASAIATFTILVFVITFKSYLGNVIRLSGAEISVTQNPGVFSVMMLALLITSVLGIVICSYARGITLPDYP